MKKQFGEQLIPAVIMSAILAHNSIVVFLITFLLVYACFCISILVLNKIKSDIKSYIVTLVGIGLSAIVVLLITLLFFK